MISQNETLAKKRLKLNNYKKPDPFILNGSAILQGGMKMCILCGEFIMQVHWTDYTDSTDTEITVGNQQRIRQRSRLHRTNLCNQLLSHYRLTLEEWNGSKFILRDAKGNAEIVHDLGTIWHHVETMIGYPIDPLDGSLLDKIAERSSAQ